MTDRMRIELFCSGLRDWFAVHKRSLPWRDLRGGNVDDRAYRILVSEVMLQQTHVARVVELYKKFIHTFPRIKNLAKASNSEVIIAWRGLGYNNRALRLRDAARKIVQRGGTFPREMSELQGLPGVGHYTAAAIRNFAFRIPTPCLDVNIRRILHRFFVGPENPDGTMKKGERYLLGLAERVLLIALERPSPRLARLASPLPPIRQAQGKRGEGTGVRAVRDAADWHAALMDFGSLVCTRNNPKWHLFPPKLKDACIAYGQAILVKRQKKNEPGREIAGRFVPNRIIRGRIVDVLRDHPHGLPITSIGPLVTVDWTLGDHGKWLLSIVEGLERDSLVKALGKKYYLHR